MIKIQWTKLFQKDYKRLPKEIKHKNRQLFTFMMSDIHYPSLRLKKMEGGGNIWEISITMQYRMTFQLDKDVCILRRIGTHDVLRHP